MAWADRKARHEPAAAGDVQHGELLGHADGRVVEGQAVAQHDKGGVGRAPGKHRRHQVRGRHDAVCVVVVLVDADPVKPYLVRVFELVQVLVVQMVSLDRIEEMAGDVDPHAAVLLLEVLGQQPVRHQVEPAYFHGSLRAISYQPSASQT